MSALELSHPLRITESLCFRHFHDADITLGKHTVSISKLYITYVKCNSVHGKRRIRPGSTPTLSPPLPVVNTLADHVEKPDHTYSLLNKSKEAGSMSLWMGLALVYSGRLIRGRI